MRRVCAISLFFVMLSCAAPGPRYVSNDDFLKCWGGQRAGSFTRIQFEATIFPRESVLSSSGSCPDLILKLRFRNTEMPASFDAFQRARHNRLESIGIQGEAIVEIERRERPDLMAVRVRQLVQGEVLTPSEADRVLSQMDARLGI